MKDLQSTMTRHLPQGIVTIESGSCAFVNGTSDMAETLDAAGTDLNFCGEPCNMHCFERAHDAPNKTECDLIAQLLLGEELIDYMHIQPGSNALTLTLGTCVATYRTHYRGSTQVPCRFDWSNQIHQVMSKCLPEENKDGGVSSCMMSTDKLGGWGGGGFYMSVQKIYGVPVVES